MSIVNKEKNKTIAISEEKGRYSHKWHFQMQIPAI